MAARKPTWEPPSLTPAVMTSRQDWGRYPHSHHTTLQQYLQEERKEGKACGWLLQLSYANALKKTSCFQRPTMRKTFLHAHWLDALNGKISCQQMPQPTKSSREGTKWKKGGGRIGGVWSNGSEGARSPLYNRQQKVRERQALNYNESNRRQRQNINVQCVSGPLLQPSYSHSADGEN